jgi:subtilisin family serine protease
MRGPLAALPLLALTLMALPAVGTPSAQAQDSTAGRTGNIIVRFTSDATLPDVAGALESADASAVKTATMDDVALLEPAPGQSVDDAIEALEADADVIYAEPDYAVTADLTPNDPHYATYQWHYPKIGLPAAWDTTTGSASIIVAVVDTGVELTDPELDSKITSGGNAGYDFANNDADPTDDHGHGTHVAGTIAAETNNATGVAGICWSCKIMPVKALDNTGNGSTFDVAAGIDWARTHGAQVVNLSLGSLFNSATLQTAVDNANAAGLVVVGAAGNNAGDANMSDDGVMYPGAYPNAIAVGATDSSDVVASFSNYGPELDVTAPGVSILSTVLGSGYQSWSGTSMATPHVAGVVGLMKAAGITDPATIRTRLTSTATDLGTVGFDNNYGHGRINAHLALDTSVAAPNITTPPNTAIVSGTVNIAAIASDPNGIASVKFYVDGALLSTDTTNPYAAIWDTTVASAGSHQLKAEARDNAGNIANHTINVTVSNGDGIPPSVSITSPTPGIVLGNVSIDASATDNVAISKVRFWAGSTYLGYDTTFPYSKSWNTAAGLNGNYVVKAQAIDTSNNTTTVQLTVTVVNPDSTPPTISITSPGGAVGTVNINANAADSQGLQKVQFWVDSTYLGYDASAPYSKPWNTTLFTDGTHTVRARAVDWANNMTETTTSVVVANNDSTAPSVSIASPLNSATVSGTISIDALASDDLGVQKVQFWVDSSYLGFDASSPYSKSWNSASVANGTHTIRVRSVDWAGNVSLDVTITVTVSN